MTPPHWLFFPTPPAAGVKLQLDAELVSHISTTRFNLTNASLSGTDDVANNYDIYTSTPLRRNSAATNIEWLFKVKNTGDYVNAGAWETEVTNAGGPIVAESTWQHNGSTIFTATSINYTGGRDNLTTPRVKWVSDVTSITNFWNLLSGGDTITIKINWS